MVRIGPFSASGGTITFTREPSGRRASTIGEASSTRRPTAGDDPLDDAHQMGVVGEAGVGLVEHACALDEHLVVAVHHHLGDPVVAQERIDRPVAEHLVDHVLDDALALVPGDPLGAAVELDLDDGLHTAPQLVRRRAQGLKLGPDLRDTHVVKRRAQLGEAIDRTIVSSCRCEAAERAAHRSRPCR